LAALGTTSGASAAATVVYGTGFDTTEGYVELDPLEGQQGWLADGTGGNGVYREAFGFPGMGLQAFVGAFPPDGIEEESLYVWRPFDLSGALATNPLVRFTVDFLIIDSTEENGFFRDEFRWSFYSTNLDHYFTLTLNNADLSIGYWLQNSAAATATGRAFVNDQRYALRVDMDFSRNTWSAWLDAVRLVSDAPITQSGFPANLGAVAAVWVYEYPVSPGDNLMVFDNYRIARDAPEPPRLTALGRAGQSFALRLEGDPGRRYAIDAAADFFTPWTPLRTNTADALSGAFDFVDSQASGPRRFYRGRWVR